MNTLLIVEDEKESRQAVKTIVRRSGISVSNVMECGDGRTALEILENQQVDMMFTGIRIPGMDGVSLVEAMQNLKHKPLVAVISGCDDFACAVRLMRMGVRDYLLKPVEQERIVDVIRRLDREISENRQNMRELRAIGCQQLKYMIMNENIPEKEVETVIRKFEKQLLDREYVVCCLENEEEEAPESSNYLYLGEIAHNRIYVVRRENREYLLKNELRDCHVGVSRIHRGVAQLREAYREARAARTEAFLQVRHEVEYDSLSLSQETAQHNTLPLNRNIEAEADKIHQVVQMIGTDKITTALRMVEQYFARIRRKEYTAHMLEKGVSMLVEEIRRTYGNALREDEETLISFKDIYRFSQSEELMEELTGWMIGFHRKMSEGLEDYKNKARLDKALKYIRENYDKDLNMAVVSNHVSMNYSMFSYAFKQYTGQNFVNYLKELRVQEARRLLVRTDMRVIDISRRVGYENEKHFMKTFKSLCGVSPTEYRKNMQFRETSV